MPDARQSEPIAWRHDRRSIAHLKVVRYNIDGDPVSAGKRAAIDRSSPSHVRGGFSMASSGEWLAKAEREIGQFEPAKTGQIQERSWDHRMQYATACALVAIAKMLYDRQGK